MNMDKIPIKDATVEDNELKLYGQAISVVEGGNIDKINQLIDWCRELQEEIFKLKGK